MPDASIPNSMQGPLDRIEAACNTIGDSEAQGAEVIAALNARLNALGVQVNVEQPITGGAWGDEKPKPTRTVDWRKIKGRWQICVGYHSSNGVLYHPWQHAHEDMREAAILLLDRLLEKIADAMDAQVAVAREAAKQSREILRAINADVE